MEKFSKSNSETKRALIPSVDVIAKWLLGSACLFLVANSISYLILTDVYLLVMGLQDVKICVGFPFVILEKGGIEGVDFFSLRAVAGNLLASSVTVAVAMVFIALMKRTSKRSLSGNQ